MAPLSKVQIMRSRIARSLAASARYRSIFSIVLSIVIVAGILLVVLFAPRLLVNSRHMILTAKDQLDAEAGIRSSLIQVFGGAVLLAGLYFTARGFRLTREGHITERYSKAIEQLGNANADVRIGGIYALERIARDSEVDRETIIDVLTTFVREHTRSGHDTPSTAKVEADVQAALTVIARRPKIDSEARRLDFYHSGLNDANFRSGHFRGAMFYYSRLDSAHFAGAKLDHAGLSFCQATGAAFTTSSARGADFVNAKYTNGWFLEADLTNADFYGCDYPAPTLGDDTQKKETHQSHRQS